MSKSKEQKNTLEINNSVPARKEKINSTISENNQESEDSGGTVEVFNVDITDFFTQFLPPGGWEKYNEELDKLFED